MGLRRRILLGQLCTLVLVSGGFLGGLLAGNLIWRRSQHEVTRLEHEIQTIDLLNIRLRQVIPSETHYRSSIHEDHLEDHLDQDIGAMQAFLLQLRRNELSGSDFPPGADLAQNLSVLLRRGEEFVNQLERYRGQLELGRGDPTAVGRVQRQLVESSELRELRASEEALNRLRDARFAHLVGSRDQEERSEVLEVLIPLITTLLACAFAFALAWNTSRNVVLPLRRLNARIQDLRTRGSLEVEPLEPGQNLPEEMQVLTNNFNSLVQRLKEVLAQLEDLSLTDPLTQVGNRRRFDQVLSMEVARHRRQGRELALLLLDLDHFKPFNDLYGHPHGDRCLIQLAQALSSLFRRPGELICRIGGEEFAVVLPETGRQDALSQAHRILTAVEELAIEHLGNPPLARVSVSVGVSCGKPDDALTGGLLVDAADRALYQCKRDLGRNTVAVAEPRAPSDQGS